MDDETDEREALTMADTTGTRLRVYADVMGDPVEFGAVTVNGGKASLTTDAAGLTRAAQAVRRYGGDVTVRVYADVNGVEVHLGTLRVRPGVTDPELTVPEESLGLAARTHG